MRFSQCPQRDVSQNRLIYRLCVCMYNKCAGGLTQATHPVPRLRPPMPRPRSLARGIHAPLMRLLNPQGAQVTMPQADQSDGAFWRQVGHRYRVARLALVLTEEEAAAAAGVTAKTWRKWENKGPRRAGHFGPLDFAVRFDVSIDWLFYGQGESIGSHLARHACGVIAILPCGKGRPIPKAVLRKRGRTTAPSQRRKT